MRRNYKNRCGAVSALLFAIILLFSAKSYSINDIHVVFFVLDGAPQKFFYEMVESGELPTLKKYFWDNGAHAVNAVTTFPSASAPAYQSFITGSFAGHSGVPYLQGFDRSRKKIREYLGIMGHKYVNDDLYPPTIFDILSDEPTAAIYSEITKGAKKRYPKVPIAPMLDAFVTHRIKMIDVRAMGRLTKVFNKPNAPRFTLVGLYSSDIVQHKKGASLPAKKILVQFDSLLAKFIDLLKKKGLFDKTYIIVASDHGMHNIDGKIDLANILKNGGINLKDIAISARGVASAQIYFKGPLNNDESQKIISALRKSDDLSLTIAQRGVNYVDVFSRDGHGIITHYTIDGENYYGYELNGTIDPLEYKDNPKIRPMIGGILYKDKKWLERTSTEKYPDAVAQLSQIFDDGRAGDILVVAKNGGFFKKKKATHGSIIADDMIIPLLVHGPGISHLKFGPVRSVDLYPTILKWFGLENNAAVDGKKINALLPIQQKQ